MPLVELPFSGGVDESLRQELVDPTASFVVAENVRQRQRGGFGKRYAFSALGIDSMEVSYNSSSVHKVFADRDTIMRVGQHAQGGFYELRAYASALSKWSLLNSYPSECTVRLIDMPSMSKTSYLQDVAYVNGYVAMTWYTSLASNVDLYAAVMHVATGAIVSPPTKVGSLTTGFPGVLTAVGTTFILVRADSGTGAIKAWYMGTSLASAITTGWTAMTDFAADFGGNNRYSVASLGTRCALIYTNTSGGASRATLTTFDTTGVLETQTIDTSSTSPDAVDVAGSTSDVLWAAWNEGTAVKAIGYQPTAITATPYGTVGTVLTATSGVQLIGIVAPFNGTAQTARMFVNSSSATMQSHMRSFAPDGGVTTGYGTATTVYAVSGAGRPFSGTGSRPRCFIPVFGADTSNLQNQIVFVDFTDDVPYLRPVAVAAPGLCTVDLVGKRTTVTGASSSIRYAPMTVRRSGVADGSALVELDFGSSRRFGTATVGNSTYMAGGVLQCIDGTRVAESSFLFRPPKPTQTNAGTGITGTFRVVATYEEVDADGNWHQSGVSTPSDAVTVTNKTITWSTAPLTVSGRFVSAGASATAVRVAWWRTTTGGEAPYYRLGTTIVDPTASAVTFADAVTDASLATQAKLYSQPGVVGTAQDHRPPPGFSIVCEFAGMLVGAADNEVWYSGQPISGEGMWFNPIFSVPLPEAVTGLASQDGVLVAFTRRAVYAIGGEPPSDNGAVGGFGAPQKLSADVGCIEPRSVCVTAMGTFFQSERGIEILTRARTVEWIGEAVQSTLESYPIVTAATFDADSSCVLIECAAAESANVVSGSGRTLVYDLSLKKWTSVDRRANAAGTADSPAQSAAMIYTGSAYRYAWLGTDGRVYVEDRTTYLDPGSTWVTMRVETGWFKLAGLQSRQLLDRLQVFARYATDHNLNVYAAYDYSTSYKSVVTWTRASIATLTASWPAQQIEFPLHVDSEGQSMRIKLEDATPTGGTVGTGQGATWVAMTVEGTPKEGAAELPPIAR